jgi:hypothetical protein
MPGSVRSGPSSPDRAILSQDAVFSVDALCKCGKPRLGRRKKILASFCLEKLNDASLRNYKRWGTSNKPIPVEIDRQEV